MIKHVMFVHVPRTGGTSIAKVVTQSGKYSYQDLSFPLLPVCDPSIWFTNVQHISIQTLTDRGVFTQKWFDSCFKLAFVRNPWDRLASLYEHLQYRPKQRRDRESNVYLSSFELFAETVCSGRFVKPIGRLATDDWSQANPQMRWIEQGVEFVGSYEKLQQGWRFVCGKIGIECVKLPHERKKKGSRDYRSYYNNRLRDMVGEFYREDIKGFGYEFEVVL